MNAKEAGLTLKKVSLAQPKIKKTPEQRLDLLEKRVSALEGKPIKPASEQNLGMESVDAALDTGADSKETAPAHKEEKVTSDKPMTEAVK